MFVKKEMARSAQDDFWRIIGCTCAWIWITIGIILVTFLGVLLIALLIGCTAVAIKFPYDLYESMTSEKSG